MIRSTVSWANEWPGTWAGRRLAVVCPVLNMQARNPTKLALFIGNKDQFANDRLRRDQRIQRTNGCGGTLKPRPNLRIRSCVAGGKFQDGNGTKEIFYQPQRLRRRTALGRAGPQFGFSNDANCNARDVVIDVHPGSRPLAHIESLCRQGQAFRDRCQSPLNVPVGTLPKPTAASDGDVVAAAP
jgi:hypothetical protein